MRALCVALVAVCSLLFGNAQAGLDLVLSRELKDVGKTLIDTHDICTTEDIVKAWKTINLDQPAFYNGQSYNSIRVLRYYKCDNREMVSIQSIIYEGKNGDGRVVDQQTTTFSELLYEPIPHDSASQTELASVCGYTNKNNK